MSQVLTDHTPYRSGHARAVAVVALLATGIAVDALGASATALKLATGNVSDPRSEELTVYDFIDLGVGLVQILIYFSTVVAFCVWLYRVHKNLIPLGHPKHSLQHSAGWAVGSFFVPFVNLVVPYRALKEVWVKSDPSVTADNFVPSYEPSPPTIFPAWWTFWLFSNFANNIALRLHLRAETIPAVTAATYFDLLGDILSVPAAIFAIAVVRSIDRRQEERSRQVYPHGNVPPPPPVYAPAPPPDFGGYQR